MKIYAININHIDFSNPDVYKQYISDRRIEQSKRFRFEADRKRSLCAEYLLNYGLKECFPEIRTPVLTAAETTNGKPYLPKNPNIHFNLSHSGDYAVCVIDDAPIGIDIEQCKNDGEKIAKRFFTEEEYLDICSRTNPLERQNQFYIYWVLKESFMKATGYGMQLSMTDFSVRLGDPITFIHEVNEQSYYAKIYDFAKGYCMAVCSEKNDDFGDLTLL